MPFNTEVVARAIAGCRVPVVSGVGHEPDTSIADMVADVRASTPTAAAEAAAPSIEELGLALIRERRALGRALQARVQSASHRVSRVAARPAFCDPHALLGPAAQTVDMARVRLEAALPQRLARDAQRVTHARARLATVGTVITERAAARVALGAARLEDLSPLAILARGYAAGFAADGRTVIHSVGQVAQGDRMVVRVSDGHIGCTVTDTTKGE